MNKHTYRYWLLTALALAALLQVIHAQIVVQHLGANDPISQGFTVFSVGDVQLGPVFDDFGFDSWKIHLRVYIESATYRYDLIPGELQASLTHGWMLTANMRFVEVTGRDWVLIEFYTETRGFRLLLSGTAEGAQTNGSDFAGLPPPISQGPQPLPASPPIWGSRCRPGPRVKNHKFRKLPASPRRPRLPTLAP
jgi:hypothetical protein